MLHRLRLLRKSPSTQALGIKGNIMHTQKTVIIIAIILAIAGIIGYRSYLSANRYTIINAGAPGVAYQIDKKSGKTWIIRGDVKTEQIDTELEKQMNDSLSQSLPIQEWARVTGNAGFSSYGDKFQGKLYNGTTWIISRFVIRVVCMEQDGSERWTREFRVDQEIPPLTTKSFSFDVTGQEGNTKIEWSISDLFGRPE